MTSKSDQKGLRYAFTEQGVAMLSAILRSEKAIKVSIEIMNALVQMRHYLHQNVSLTNRLDAIENKVDAKFIEHELKFEKIDENFSKIFNELDTAPFFRLKRSYHLFRTEYRFRIHSYIVCFHLVTF